MSLVEILVAVLVLSVGLLPVLTMTRTTTKKTSFSEFQVFFEARAQRIMEQFMAYNYDYIAALGDLQPGDPTPKQLPLDLADPPVPEEYSRKLKPGSYSEKAWAAHVPGRGRDMIELTVRLEWSFPTTPNPHDYTLVRLLARPDISLTNVEGPYATP